MKIENATGFTESWKQWSLDPKLTPEQIGAKLPGVVDQGESFDGKATHYWDFFADDQPCSIWDYRGKPWSGFGPREVFEQLGLTIVGEEA